MVTIQLRPPACSLKQQSDILKQSESEENLQGKQTTLQKKQLYICQREKTQDLWEQCSSQNKYQEK